MADTPEDTRLAYLTFTDTVGRGWIGLFEGDTEFYSAAYWDLFTYLWRHGKPVRKTEALRAITGVKSPLTAAKYVDTAVRRGLIEERPNPEDARSKVLTLAPALRDKLDRFFDDAIDIMRRTVADL